MKIRFLTALASEKWVFQAGDTLEVAGLTPEISRWLSAHDGRPPIAEVIKNADEDRLAVAPVFREEAVAMPIRGARRGARGRESSDD